MKNTSQTVKRCVNTRLRCYKKYRVVLICVCVLLIGSMMGTAMAANTNGNRSRVIPGTLGLASIAPNADGKWENVNRMQAVPIGGREELSLPIYIGKDVNAGENLHIAIESDALDLVTATLAVVVENDGVVLARYLDITSSQGALDGGTMIMNSSMSIDALWRLEGVKVTLYLVATRTGETGSVTVSLMRDAGSGMKADTVFRVGAYNIQKQGNGAAAVESAAGLSGMTNIDTVYIISNAERELIRVMIEDGEVFGLAIREGSVVAGVEYDLNRKVYVNTLTQRQVLTRDELMAIFNALDFSFLRAPDERAWLSKQDAYTVQRTMIF